MAELLLMTFAVQALMAEFEFGNLNCSGYKFFLVIIQFPICLGGNLGIFASTTTAATTTTKDAATLGEWNAVDVKRGGFCWF